MYIASATVENITRTVTDWRIQPDEIVFIFLAEKQHPNLQALVDSLNQIDICFAGGVFPGLINGGKKEDEGAILLRLPMENPPCIIPDLDSDLIELPARAHSVCKKEPGHHTALILADGLAPNISGFLAELFNILGDTVHYLGGGTGYLSLKQEPSLFCPQGVFQNAALVSCVSCKSSLGVKHGWERVMGPLVATKTEGNRILELNWENAFEVYREVVEKDSKKIIIPSRFMETAKAYPFGIIKEQQEDLVRDPLMMNSKGELICVGDIPENAALFILKGKSSELIKASSEAANISRKGCQGSARQCLVFDCVSRSLFLGKNYENELAAIAKKIKIPGTKLVSEGVLSLGEISSYGHGYLEFFNKTTVVGILTDE